MNLLLDTRLAFRSLAKRPGAALVMILTLAVGLGVNAAIFGVLDRLVNGHSYQVVAVARPGFA